jgi:hypothetical protein
MPTRSGAVYQPQGTNASDPPQNVDEFSTTLRTVQETLMEASSGPRAQIPEGLYVKLSKQVVDCHRAHENSVKETLQYSEHTKLAVKLYTCDELLRGGEHATMYQSMATKIHDPQHFTCWDLGVISKTFCDAEFDPQDLVPDHPSEACELYNKIFFGTDTETMTCLTAQPCLEQPDDGRSDNYLYAPGEESSGHAMAIGNVVPEAGRYHHSGVMDDLYEAMFGSGQRGAMQVIDWYGERGGSKGVWTQHMSRLAFITIGDGVPLLLGCQDSHAGTFRIIGRGVNALLRFPDYGDEEPEDMQLEENEEPLPSVYVFVAIPPGASAPETYDDTLRKMSSRRGLDQREQKYLNRLLQQMNYRSEE